jgi:hypothetical protein
VDDLAVPGDPELERFKTERFEPRPRLVHVGCGASATRAGASWRST